MTAPRLNELFPNVFSRTVERNAAGVATVAGVPVTDLVREYGSPLFVLDEADARHNATALLTALSGAAAAIGTTARVYYAGKAFLCAEVVNWVSDSGLGVDVCSEGELLLALSAGVDPAKVGLHGNTKSPSEIDLAVRAGVGSIVIDSEAEIARVAQAAARHGVVQPVRLRVNSGVHAHTHEFLATAHEDQKFGVPMSAAGDLVRSIRSFDSLRFLGLHCHIGSQIFSAEGFAESAQRLLTVHAELLREGPVPELNLGGGFGIRYLPDDEPPAIEQFAAEIMAAVAKSANELNVPLPVLAFEPGRAVIGRSAMTLYTVGTIKPVQLEDGTQRTYVSVDGGMSDNARPALYQAQYCVKLASRESAAPPLRIRLAGKHCESGDVLIDDDVLPADIAVGDIVAVPATGAYCWSLASNYNYAQRPPVVAVRDGQSRVIVRGDSMADLLRRDCGIADATAAVDAWFGSDSVPNTSERGKE